jgi:hypothetical protein
MLVGFESLVPPSRIWIYQANRAWTSAEETAIQESLQVFCDQWSAHSHPLKTSFRLEYHRFLILGVDETSQGASGCSIDGSVRVLKSLQDQLHIDFFDRSRVAFLVEGKVNLVPLKELKSAFASGQLTPTHLVFNTQVTTKAEWDKSWILPAKNTWVSRYFLNPTVA